MRFAVAAVLFAVGLLATAALAVVRTGTAGGDERPPTVLAVRGNMSLSEARRFRGFSLYYLGGRFDGMPLTGVVSADAYGAGGGAEPADDITFLYGTCVSRHGQGCMPPLQVRMESACSRPNRSYADIRVRGVTGRWLRRGLALHTHDTTITIAFMRGNVSRAKMRGAVMALRGVNTRLRPKEPFRMRAGRCTT